jgi:serine protease
VFNRPLSAVALSLLPIACSPVENLDGTLALTDTEAYLEREVLVGFSGASAPARASEFAGEFGLTLLEHNDQLSVGRFRIEGPESEKEMAQLIGEDSRVQYAEPNFIAFASGTQNPSDPYLGYQWNLDRVGVPAAWAYGQGSGLTVAVLDTGVLANGPDGFDRLLSGYDFYYGDSDPSDRDGHGTFVAGTIAQSTDNGVGVAGIAPDAAILPVKVLSDQGYGDIQAIANGITWSADQGADVINMSLGSAYPSQTLERACAYAYDQGAVLVAATGNEFSSRVNYPAAYDTVIGVGATRADDSRAGYSNTGPGIDLMAPGGDLSRDQSGDGYADGVLQETIEGGRWTYTFWEGTSMAAPHVAAAAALILEQGDYSPDEVYSILASTTRDLGTPGYDSETGYGLIHIEAALALARGSGSPPTDAEAPEPSQEETEAEASEAALAISDVSGWADGDSFTLQWTTSSPADSYVEFEGYGTYGDPSMTTRHTLRFRGSPGTDLTFTLQSTDASGQLAEDGPWTISL